MDLGQRISERDSGFLLYALTPPRLATSAERAQEIADATVERLEGLKVDGLVLYDIADEADRTAQERPFPFLPTMDPADFLSRHLQGWRTPVVVYRAVGKYPEEDVASWLRDQDPARVLTVFVGAASRTQPVKTSLVRAQELRRAVRPELTLGGVAIPERHRRAEQEHVRLLTKQAAGCSFFVTQMVYDVDAAKSMVSDYHHACAAQGVEPVPVVFTLSVCGSTKTLDFIRWLGVDVPRWVHNELHHAESTLDASVEHALDTARELLRFCRRLGMPFGFNVESVSIRRAEIEASVSLARMVREELDGAASR